MDADMHCGAFVAKDFALEPLTVDAHLTSPRVANVAPNSDVATVAGFETACTGMTEKSRAVDIGTPISGAVLSTTVDTDSASGDGRKADREWSPQMVHHVLR